MGNINRRRVLRFGTAGVCALLTGPAFANLQSRDLSFENLHTGEKAAGTYWRNGEYVVEVLNAFDYLLRDHRTDEVLSIDRHLFDQLHRLKTLVGSNQPFQVISGFRSARTNAMLARRSGGVSRRSYHQFGMAIDIRLPGTDLGVLRDAALSMKAGGVGYYRRSNFVHLDTGRARFW